MNGKVKQELNTTVFDSRQKNIYSITELEKKLQKLRETGATHIEIKVQAAKNIVNITGCSYRDESMAERITRLMRESNK